MMDTHGHDARAMCALGGGGVGSIRDQPEISASLWLPPSLNTTRYSPSKADAIMQNV